jgi:hypothetical protein
MKKPVDRTPICDPACLRRIDPVWASGRVPYRFWEDRTHRRDYLLWLAQRVGFRTMEDYYRLRLSTAYRRNHGRGLRSYWAQSALEAVQDCFPEYDWKPWLFTRIPRGFWGSPANRRSYLDWLGERLGYRCRDDWYDVTCLDFTRNKGVGIMKHYRHSPARAVIDLIPGRNWREWKFRHLPSGFWESAENRHRYLRWLGKELGFRHRKDWYRIQFREIIRRHGSVLLRKYSSSYDLMREFLPQLDWDRIDKHQPIRVKQILAWADAHHARHGAWPTERSGEIPGTDQTWRGLNACMRSGLRGLSSGISLAKFLKKHRGVRVGRRPPHLSEEQVLAWADIHFAAQGNWPTERSGPIPGTKEKWMAVANAMRVGLRGFRRGSSLAQLLARRRGMRRKGMRLPPLKERQILAWARAFFKTTGRRPSTGDGPIAQSPGDTWRTVDAALRAGGRGLQCRSSLRKLLHKHGLK